MPKEVRSHCTPSGWKPAMCIALEYCMQLGLAPRPGVLKRAPVDRRSPLRSDAQGLLSAKPSAWIVRVPGKPVVAARHREVVTLFFVAFDPAWLHFH